MDLEEKEQFERFFADLMSVEEKKAFKQELEQNRELQQAFLQQSLEREAMRLIALEDMKAKFDQWEAETEEDAPQPVKVRRLNWRIAAAASVLIIAGIFLVRWLGQPSATPKIAQVNLEELPSDIVRKVRSLERGEPSGEQEVRGSQEAIKDPQGIEKALVLYDAKQFQQAAAMLDTVAGQPSEVKRFQAYCYWQLGDLNRAEELFLSATNPQLSSQPSLENAEGDLLIFWWNTEQLEPPFYQLLDKIFANKNHNYHPTAEKIKKALE